MFQTSERLKIGIFLLLIGLGMWALFIRPNSVEWTKGTNAQGDIVSIAAQPGIIMGPTLVALIELDTGGIVKVKLPKYSQLQPGDTIEMTTETDVNKPVHRRFTVKTNPQN